MPRIVDKKQKAESLARAGLRVFRSNGFHKTRMKDIARAANVGKGTLYEYFHDKTDILRFSFEQYFRAFQAGATSALQNAPPNARLLAFVDFALHHSQDWQDHCAVYVDYLGAARADDANRMYLDKIYDEMRDLLMVLLRDGQSVGAVRQDLDPDATADLLLAIFDGIVLHGALKPRRCPEPTMGRVTISVLTRGLLAPHHDDGG